VNEATSGSFDPEPVFEFVRPRWQARAACHPATLPKAVWEPWGDSPTDLFFPEGGCSPARRKVIESVCAGCPVQQECYEHGVSHEKDGFWGGAGSVTLRRTRSTRQLRLQTPEIDPGTHLVIGTFYEPGHGTQARYQRHRREGTPVCPACQAAHREAMRPQKAAEYAAWMETATDEEKAAANAARRVRERVQEADRRRAQPAEDLDGTWVAEFTSA